MCDEATKQSGGDGEDGSTQRESKASDAKRSVLLSDVLVVHPHLCHAAMRKWEMGGEIVSYMRHAAKGGIGLRW